jgi:hypothetical protein
MKTIALIISLAIGGIAISGAFVSAEASKMNGKAYGSSDGFRSAKAKKASKNR